MSADREKPLIGNNKNKVKQYAVVRVRPKIWIIRYGGVYVRWRWGAVQQQ